VGEAAPGGEAGAGVIGGVGWSCALALPQLENRTVATIVELSKPDRRAPKRLPAKELYMVSRAPTCVIENHRLRVAVPCIEVFRLRLNHTVKNDRTAVNRTGLLFYPATKRSNKRVAGPQLIGIESIQ
jgi:hypothetical protein